jgi:DNA invertase Pin-like site-specific DNA recombinase
MSEDGYLALWVAICCSCTVETAFKRLKSKRPSLVRPVISPLDVEDMQKMRAQGLTYQVIAEIYGTSRDAVRRRIERGA